MLWQVTIRRIHPLRYAARERVRQARPPQPDAHALVTHVQTFAAFGSTAHVDAFNKFFVFRILVALSVWQQSCLTITGYKAQQE